MIVNYHDKRTEDFAAGKRIRAFSGIDRAARLKIDRLEAASSLKDLAALPGNRFEALRGDREGQYSIRINDQWRRPVANLLRVATGILGAFACRDCRLSLSQEDGHGHTRNSSRRTSSRGVERAWHERCSARPTDCRTHQPHHRNPKRAACDHRRYSPSAWLTSLAPVPSSG